MELKFKCKQCGKEFVDNRGHFNRIFCSIECRRINRQVNIKEVGKKISLTKMGHSVSQETRNKISNFFRGKTYEEIMGKEKAEIRKEKSKQRITGEKNFFWEGGKTKYLKYDWKKFNLKFKNLIRKRDNQICMNCGIHREKMNKALDVHHIDYNETNTIPENCISLCRKCHGLTQLNKKYWTVLFQRKLSKLYGYNFLNEVIIEYA